MGVYIPNMEKPKECKECQWHLDFYIEDEQVGGLCTITEKDDKENICPLIDIVQCKDCKWLGIDDGMTFCNVWLREVERHMFCSYGERRADGNKRRSI